MSKFYCSIDLELDRVYRLVLVARGTFLFGSVFLEEPFLMLVAPIKIH